MGIEFEWVEEGERFGVSAKGDIYLQRWDDFGAPYWDMAADPTIARFEAVVRRLLAERRQMCKCECVVCGDPGIVMCGAHLDHLVKGNEEQSGKMLEAWHCSLCGQWLADCTCAKDGRR